MSTSRRRVRQCIRWPTSQMPAAYLQSLRTRRQQPEPFHFTIEFGPKLGPPEGLGTASRRPLLLRRRPRTNRQPRRRAATATATEPRPRHRRRPATAYCQRHADRLPQQARPHGNYDCDGGPRQYHCDSDFDRYAKLHCDARLTTSPSLDGDAPLPATSTEYQSYRHSRLRCCSGRNVSHQAPHGTNNDGRRR